MTVKPYKQSGDDKKQQVAQMFNNIAPKYDFLNHVLSLGIDKLWRKKAIKILKNSNIQSLLDVATGTGDFAIAALKAKPKNITGIDISEKMLEVGRLKIEKLGLSHQITLLVGDSENLQFESESFDAVTVAFGVRNFENLAQGIHEIYRVLKPGGKAVILEFSQPQAFPFKQLYNFYFYKILPFVGRLVSKDASAYTYLPESVEKFPSGKAFLEYLQNAKFSKYSYQTLTMGVATIYTAEK